MSTPQSIVNLVDRFGYNINDYKKGNYNETQVRIEFIDPLFTELGWDVNNKSGYAEAYKDVIHEFTLKTKDVSKAPDYLFRIGGIKKFFVEAKKPSVNIKDDISPAFQLRRYAWSAKLPLSILTDFEEFAIYDARIQPKKNDKSSTGRIKYYTFEDYLSKWDEIESVFSREAVLKGSFDKFADTNKIKKGTTTVDDAFLSEIEKWREMLARNIAIRNNSLSNRELNFAVQKTIDRIIFLRICEDRGIEDYGQLMNLQNGVNVYDRLKQIFTRADEKYNSGLFHFEDEKSRTEEPDKITTQISIDDKTLKDIIHNLYYPESPYEFSVLPADILGHVYEQFLGKVIRLTAGHQAKIDEKPEVKKAGGVYYTPTYIVDYIVKNTLGKKLDEIEEKYNLKNCHAELAYLPARQDSVSNSEIPAQGRNDVSRAVKEVAKIKVLDPACGSGSFLIGAYQYLLDWHLRVYTSSEETRQAASLRKDSPVFQVKENEYRLTTAEKKRILLSNIFGVDIDSQAVEVTKLSLLLKVLEGETDESLLSQMNMFRERALPDLSKNIKCGNSLIGPDFYAQTELQLDEEELYRINVFDWNEEFKEIMSGGGFDIVIGNPPWGAFFENNQKQYLRESYLQYHVRTPESFNYFIAKAIHLERNDGMIGVIIPSSFLNQHEFWKTRKHILEVTNFQRICNLGDGVFWKVNSPSCIIVLGDKLKENYFYDYSKVERKLVQSYLEAERLGIIFEKIGDNSDTYNLQINENADLLKKCYKWPRLKEIAEDVATGISSGLDKAYVLYSEQIKNEKLEMDLLKKLVLGKEVNRYAMNPISNKKIIYITSANDISDYPNIKQHLMPFKDKLKKRREAAKGSIAWYSLNWPRRKKLFSKSKILIRQTANRILGTIDDNNWYCLKSIIIIQLPDDSPIVNEYLLALLNSSLFNYLYDNLVGEQSRIFPEVKPVQLFKLPIRMIDKNNSTEIKQYENLVNLVKLIIELHHKISVINLPQEKTQLQRQIDALDKQIDQLVYELYGLTEEEIKIVEESVN
ncbi:MAG: N-6 DNA methylase [Melioribacteraceae bacterium]|nr:N-6 DNA methylase [Melioribacteraceae bacterium]MCF8430486.1 N-6 DNA methylase [Melioribacteraceae bacterium]